MRIHVATCDRATGNSKEDIFEAKEGTTLAQFAEAHGLQDREIGLWCRHVKPETVLKDEDCIDVATPLLVDPQQARRLRDAAKTPVRISNFGRHGSKHRLVKSS